MRRAALCLLFAAVAVAASAAGPPDPARLLTAEATLAPSPEPGKGTLRVLAKLAPGWHVNSHKPSEDYLIPTSLTLTPVEGVSFGEPRYPEGKLEKFSFSDKPLSVYAGEFRIDVSVSWTGAAASVTGSVEFQACNDTQCLAPASVPFRTGPAPAASGGATLAGGAIPLSEARRVQPPTPAAGASRDFGDLLARKGLFAVLLILFGTGLALNLTPCVYPVIPLTVSFFGGQAHGQNRRTFLLAAIYVLGMATMYSALGVAAALSGRLFGAALQSSWVLGLVALALVALALSMFGLYDLRMPTFLMQKAGARQGVLGAYAMGLLVGVVAAPCVGPAILALLAFVATTQNAGLGFLFFFVLSLGLGFPFLFLAAFSGKIAALPRAGAWMEGVKKIFGWVLLAMAAYFLRTALPPPIGPWLLPAVLVAGAIGLLVFQSPLSRGIRAPVAVLFLGAAVFLAPQASSAPAGPAWSNYDPARVASLGRPAIVDFTASWCVPCIELDHKTFSDSRVKEALSRRALFKADMTRAASAETVALAEKHRILGVPTVIFLDASGQEREDLRLVGFEGPDAFLKRLEKAP
ncbi:MAG: cytochrome c biogenesis protein CcdA [Thermoanaerobaculia bacterium]